MTDSSVDVPTAGVAVTAIGVAVIRARETERSDRLYDDPLAQVFVDAARGGFDAERWRRLLTLADQFYEGRTIGVRLVDDRFRGAVESGIRQIVLLGAGLDTRAFRMDIPPDVTIFEIDLPELFDFKEPLLRGAEAAPSCTRRVIPTDLRGDWPTPLRDSGFSPAQPTLWVDEGVLGYLSQEWNRRVVRTLTDVSAPGSLFGAATFAVDQNSPRYRELRGLVGGDAGPTDSSPPDVDVRQWLESLGWDTEFRAWNDMVAHFDRPAPISDETAGNIVAVRR